MRVGLTAWDKTSVPTVCILLPPDVIGSITHFDCVRIGSNPVGVATFGSVV